MAKDPAVLFYTSDFLSGVAFFTMEQRGQYITLLCEQHQHYSIPENHMIFVCGSIDSIVIKKFVKDTDGTYYNERMREEAIKRKEFCKSRSNNKSGRKSKKSYDKHKNNHMNIHMENENENENIIKNDVKNKVIPQEVFELNDWCKDYFHEKFINDKSLDCFDKLINLDNYTVDEIKMAISWARNDQFWTSNFLTPVKLRSKNKDGVKYIDVFLVKIKTDGRKFATSDAELAGLIAKHFA